MTIADMEKLRQETLAELQAQVDECDRLLKADAGTGADNDSPRSNEQAESASPSVLLIRGEK